MWRHNKLYRSAHLKYKAFLSRQLFLLPSGGSSDPISTQGQLCFEGCWFSAHHLNMSLYYGDVLKNGNFGLLSLSQGRFEKDKTY